MSNFIKFNRHEIYNVSDLDTIYELTSDLREIKYYEKKDCDKLLNMIQGLYDGYKYGNLRMEAERLELPETFQKKLEDFLFYTAEKIYKNECK